MVIFDSIFAKLEIINYFTPSFLPKACKTHLPSINPSQMRTLIHFYLNGIIYILKLVDII